MKREACLVVVLEKVAGPGTDDGDRDAECRSRRVSQKRSRVKRYRASESEHNRVLFDKLERVDH